MRRWFVTALLVAGALSSPLLAQKQGQLFLSVTGTDGTPVEGVTAADVSITEDGTECKTLKVEPIDWPSKVQVLIDNGQANTTPINPLRDGLKAFFAEIPDGTEMSMYVTAGNVRPIVKPTTDKQKLIDGISLIAPDSNIGQFFDALLEASERVRKDKTPGFTTLVIVGTDLGEMRVLDRDYQKLVQNVFNNGITTHVLLTVTGKGSSGQGQIDLGINLTKMSGGRYENLNSPTRFATLLPEIGKQVAASIALQSHQYRVTYERPDKAKDSAQVGASVRKAGNVRLSLHGNY